MRIPFYRFLLTKTLTVAGPIALCLVLSATGHAQGLPKAPSFKDLQPRKAVPSSQNTKALDASQLYKDTMKSLETPFDDQKYIEKLGPGVTGGGDSCAQKIAASFDFLEKLVKGKKLNLPVPNQKMLDSLHATKISFGKKLQQDQEDVEALNIPKDKKIIIDRKICENSFEPLLYYTPILLHEMFRIVGVNDVGYKVSSPFLPVITEEISKKINLGRRFRVLTNPEGRYGRIALAWGVKGQNIDFEKLDRMTREQSYKFCDKHEIQNFLVDTVRMKIITEIKDTSYANFGDGQYTSVCQTNELDDYKHYEIWMYDGGRIQMVYDQNDDGIAQRQVVALNENHDVVGLCDQCEKDIFRVLEKYLPPSMKNYKKDTWYMAYDLVEPREYSKDASADWTAKLVMGSKEDPFMYQFPFIVHISFKNGKFVYDVLKTLPPKKFDPSAEPGN
jgi:hypothetical protein